MQYSRFFCLILAVMIHLFSMRVALAERLPDPLRAGWQGVPVCEQIHETQQLRILRCTFPPD